jgi:hypothetical protein
MRPAFAYEVIKIRLTLPYGRIRDLDAGGELANSHEPAQRRRRPFSRGNAIVRTSWVIRVLRGMAVELLDFEYLINPLALDEFLSSYWERRHLRLERRQPNYYQALITAADLERVISESDLRYPAIRLAKGAHCAKRSVAAVLDRRHGHRPRLRAGIWWISAS